MSEQETYVVGVDLGQKRDWTAALVLARIPLAEPIAGKSTLYAIRHIDRVRRMSYVDIGRRIRTLVEKLAPAPPVVLDFTGVGRAVRNIMDELRIRAELIPVTITSGDTAHQEDGIWRVPKKDLVAATATLLEAARLKIGPTVPHASTLTAELANFRCRISASGHDTYGAGGGPDWREGAHDDLVLGASLACWWAEKGGRTFLPDDISAPERPDYWSTPSGGGAWDPPTRSRWGEDYF
jgi:hypothetical protein